MVRTETRLRVLTLGMTVMLVVAACGGSSSTPSPARNRGWCLPGTRVPGPGEQAPSEGPTAGGTIYILTQAEQWDQVDPQRVYTGEDLAFFGATIYRSLVNYQFSERSGRCRHARAGHGDRHGHGQC